MRNVSILTSLAFILFAFTDNLKLSPDIIFWIITCLSAIGNLFSAGLFNIINRSWAVEIVYEDSKTLLKLNAWLRIGSAQISTSFLTRPVRSYLKRRTSNLSNDRLWIWISGSPLRNNLLLCNTHNCFSRSFFGIIFDESTWH